jgi:integrase
MRDYLDWYRSHRKAASDAEARANRDILPHFKDVPVAELTAVQIRKWHQGLASSPVRFRPGATLRKTREITGEEGQRARKHSANRTLTTLRAALNFAVNEGRIPASLADAWKPVRAYRGVDKPRIRFFDSEEVRKLLKNCPPDFRKLVTAALLTGARYGELTAMRVSDVGGGHIRVSGKTDGRLIFFNEEGALFFVEQAAGREPEDCLFLRSDGMPWQRSHQTRRMSESTSSAKIRHPNSFHILRHTYASHYLMAGGSLEGLARQLGHADTRMTIRAYAHLASSWRAAEAMAAAPTFGFAPSVRRRPRRPPRRQSPPMSSTVTGL